VDFGIFAAPAYLRRRGTPRTFAELARHDAVALNAAAARVRWTLTGPEGREESVELPCSVTANLLMFTCKAAEQGRGPPPLAEVVAGPLVEAGKLVRVLPDWRRRGPGLSVVSPGRAFESLAVRTFKQGLVDELTRLNERWGTPFHPQ